MRIPSSFHNQGGRDQETMTAMIDVVFLLLVFFVCAAVGQLKVTVLGTELGSGAIASPIESDAPPPPDLINLELRQSPAGETITRLNEQEYTDQERLKQTLLGIAELAPDIPVVLDIGPDVPLGAMITVYDTCRAAAFEQIDFAVDPQRLKKSMPATP